MKIKEFFEILWYYISYPFVWRSDKEIDRKLREIAKEDNEKLRRKIQEEFSTPEESGYEKFYAKYTAHKNGELPDGEPLDFTSEEFLKFCNDSKKVYEEEENK